MNTKQKLSLVFNLLIFVLAAFSAVAMFVGFSFMGESSRFTAIGFEEFKYFTVDSNVFAGLVSLLIVLRILCKKETKSPLWLSVLKLAATTAVTLTMMVTVFFLAPTSSGGYFSLFLNSNLFMHLIIPLLCIVSFVFFEPCNIPFKLTVTAAVPMLLYAVYYGGNILLHLENGQTSSKYDWYGFLGGGMQTFPVVIIGIALLTWGFALALWKANRIANK
ncbi:MAG: hypothetical protein IIT68_00355 [Treponema sp.]|nr:hypothetical protein [Treponema sp.]